MYTPIFIDNDHVRNKNRWADKTIIDKYKTVARIYNFRKQSNPADVTPSSIQNKKNQKVHGFRFFEEEQILNNFPTTIATTKSN